MPQARYINLKRRLCKCTLFISFIYSQNEICRINLGRDIVEAESLDLWENDDQPSDEDQEAIDSEEDELMQEPESRKVVCSSVYTEARAGDLESDSESDLWEEFEVWKEEEERIEYERWYEGRKEYEEFERWTAHEQVGGDWDDREEWSDISKSAGDDDWSLFEQWQESEQLRAFNWLVEQEKHWMIFKNETYLDSEDVIQYGINFTVIR